MSMMAAETPFIVSFDVGIKNLAVCILEIATGRIMAWKSFDLLFLNNTNDKILCQQCKKRAVYSAAAAAAATFCKKHAAAATATTATTTFLMPPQSGGLHKKSKTELLELVQQIGLSVDVTATKAGLLETLQGRMLKPMPCAKRVKAQDVSLIELAKRMTSLLDDFFASETFLLHVNMQNVPPLSQQQHHVLIENQISPIAGRMKTLQGILTEYFVIRHPHADIQYVSSGNKLRGKSEAATYSGRKADGIEMVRAMLLSAAAAASGAEEQHPVGATTDWLAWFNEQPKKDDLADAYLQGAWFLEKGRKHNIASF